jgi:predicted HD superfamily hydrolase involved in NAD metabolism
LDEAQLKRLMDAELPAGLSAHIARVVELTDRYARRHQLDVTLARLMAQGHDLLRALPDAELLARAEVRAARGEFEIGKPEREYPVLLHGPLGALELSERFGLDDPRCLHAVWWHTPGHPDYDDESWAMFVADKVDPQKVARWPVLAQVAALAEHDLREAAAQYLDLQTARAAVEGWEPHPQAKLARAVLPDPRAL